MAAARLPPGVVAGHQHVDVATARGGGGDGVERRALDGGVVVFGNDEGPCRQITFCFVLEFGSPAWPRRAP